VLAQAVAESINSGLRRHHNPCPGRRPVEVTVSMGRDESSRSSKYIPPTVMPGICVLNADTNSSRQPYRHVTGGKMPVSACVRLSIHPAYLIPFLCCIVEQTDIVVHVKVEQRSRLASGLVHDEIVKCIVLQRQRQVRRCCGQGNTKAYVWNDQILL
jgi:hypothetical protein